MPLCNKCFQLGRRHFLKGKQAPLPHRDIDDDESPKKCSRISIAAKANGAANGFATENNEHFFEENSEDETTMAAHAQDVDIPATNVCGHEEVRHIHEQCDEAPTCPHDRTNAFWCSECNEVQDSASTWHVPKASAANNAGKRVENAATAMGTRIPGVVDASIASAEVTRGPSLLGAAPGVCSSPAKAELRYSSSTEQDRGGCNNDLLLDRQRLAIKKRPLDDLQIDRRRLKRRLRTELHDDLQLDRRRMARNLQSSPLSQPAACSAQDAPT